MDTNNQDTKIELYDGKYTIIYNQGSNGQNHKFEALRYGEPWRDLTGDGLILALVQKIIDLQEAIYQEVGER
jgi:hypothetical protein